MSENVVINGVAYNGVDSLALTRADGTVVTFYPDAVRYVTQTLTEAQKAQARKNIGAQAELTAADQESIVQQVITALGTPVFGRVEEGNKITLSTEHLADGTYYFGYEDKDGNWVEIGTLNHTVVPEPTYTNAFTLAIDSNKQPYNGGKGWKDGYRLNSSATESQDAAADVTGFIPVLWGDTLYLRDISMPTSGNSLGKNYIYVYDASFANIGAYFRGDSSMASAISKGGITVGADGNVSSIKLDGTTFDSTPSGSMNTRYVRFSCDQITDDSLITINVPIV